MGKTNSIVQAARATNNLQVIVLVVFIVASIATETTFPLPQTAMRITQFGCTCAAVLIEVARKVNYSHKELIIIALLAFVCLQSRYLHYSYLADLLVIVFCMRNLDYEKVVGITLKTVALTVGFTFFCSHFGLIQNEVFERLSLDSRWVSRSCYGFVWPSRMQTYLLAILCFYLSYRKKESSIVVVGMLVLLGYLSFRGTDARYPFAVLMVVAALAVLLKAFPRLDVSKQIFKLPLTLMFPLSAVCSIYLALAYSPFNATWQYLNEVLSGRLALTSLAFSARETTLFGDPESVLQSSETMWNVGYTDSGFLTTFFNFGILFWLVYVAALSYTAYRCASQGEPHHVLSLVALAIMSLFYGQMTLSITYSVALHLAVRAVLGKPLASGASEAPKKPAKRKLPNARWSGSSTGARRIRGRRRSLS